MNLPPIFVPTLSTIGETQAIGIAHRGSRLLWPENTEVAFQGAAALGYRRFETDLRVTSDGVLLCYHDPVLSRTTNGQGFVAGATFDQVRRLDAGYRHRLDGGFPYRNQGIVVPTFAEMATAFPEAGWVLDLKADGTEEALANVIKDLELTDRVIVGSFSNERLDSFRRLTAGKVATSTPPAETMRAVIAATAPRLSKAGGRRASRSRNPGVFHESTCALQVPATWYGVPVVSRKLVTLAHAQGRLVHVWTVNGLDEIEYLTELGVDGLITDRPDLVRP
jgi:glycerophosphoryl diester phosphodiesterase